MQKLSPVILGINKPCLLPHPCEPSYALLAVCSGRSNNGRQFVPWCFYRNYLSCSLTAESGLSERVTLCKQCSGRRPVRSGMKFTTVQVQKKLNFVRKKKVFVKVEQQLLIE